MQALFFTGNSEDPLEWREAPYPELLEPGDAIVQPLAVAACDLDRSIVNGRSPFPGSFAMGHEFTGRVEAVGSAVGNLAVGDVVLASFQPSCGTCQTCNRNASSVCEAVPNGTMYGIGETGGDWGGAIADAIRIPWAASNLIKVPDSLDPVHIASASDNLADGLRGVDEPLQSFKGGSVLIAGAGSIPLYALLCARFLGAGKTVVASSDQFVLQVAETLGADCLQVDRWPKRFDQFDITVDCTNSLDGLGAVVRSTAPHGICTSSSIFFQGDVAVPMFHMNMKGISFHTGRVNSASSLERVLGLLKAGLDPELVDPAYYRFEDAIQGMLKEPLSRKVIMHRN